MYFTINQVAEILDVSPHTLRYYEKAGILFDIERSGNGHRHYSEKNILHIQKKAMQPLLNDIK